MHADMDWLPDVSELIASVRQSSHDPALSRTSSRGHQGVVLPSVRPTIPPRGTKEVPASSDSAVRPSSRELPLRSLRERQPRYISSLVGGLEPRVSSKGVQEQSHAGGRQDYRPKSGRKDSKNALRGTGRDSDIVSAMAQRLSRVERELAQKNLEVEALRCELDVCRRALARFDGSVETLSVEQENEDLKNQVCEMKQFLADYGLTWIGENESNPSLDKHQEDVRLHLLQASMAPEAGTKRDFPSSSRGDVAKNSNGKGDVKAVDISYIEARVDALNTIAEKESKIVKQNGIARFDMDRRVLLTFFRDGLRVGTLPFFRYESEQGTRTLQDIIDGYFPYCLKQQYPEGVPLHVKDETSQVFSDFEDVHKKFVQRLPTTIITEDGNIHDIRNMILGRMASPERTEQGSKDIIDLRPEDSMEAPMCKIQVRDGAQSWVLQLNAQQTIGDLKAAIPARGTFSLRSAFPPRRYDTEECSLKTLESAGLVPNANLFIHRD